MRTRGRLPHVPRVCALAGRGIRNNIGVDLGANLFTRVANESTAFFGQGTFKLTDKLSTTIGLRWTRDTKELQLIHRREASGAYVVGAPEHRIRFATTGPKSLRRSGWNCRPRRT